MATLELCASSYKDAYKASFYHIKRIELNSALSLGGLTPSYSLFNKIHRDFPDLDIICMVRIRPGGFNYSDQEYEIMKEDVKYFLSHGAKGIAFGFLNEDHTINESRTKQFIELIHSYNTTAVFHRAIDLTNDISASTAKLVSLHIDRILTSGGKENAIKGKEVIATLVKEYGHQVDIQAGCGINSHNVKELLDLHVSSIHGSFGKIETDTTSYNDFISFDYIGKGQYEVVDENKLKLMMDIIKEY